jgi:hypothetical protein
LTPCLRSWPPLGGAQRDIVSACHAPSHRPRRDGSPLRSPTIASLRPRRDQNRAAASASCRALGHAASNRAAWPRRRPVVSNGAAANSPMSAHENVACLGGSRPRRDLPLRHLFPRQFGPRRERRTAQDRSINGRKFARQQPSPKDRAAIFASGRRGGARRDRLRRTSFLLLTAPIEELLE